MLNLGKMYRQIKPPDRGVSLHEGGLGSCPSPVMISSLSGRFGALSVSKVIFCWSEKTKNSTPHSVHIVVLKTHRPGYLVLFLLPCDTCLFLSQNWKGQQPTTKPKHRRAQSKPVPAPSPVKSQCPMMFDTRR